MQVFKKDHERLIETLAQQHPLDGVQDASASDLPVHLVKRRGVSRSRKQEEEIGKAIFETAIERQHFAGDFLSPPSVVILGGELEIVLEEVNQWEVRIRLAMRDGERFEDQTPTL